MNAIRFANTIKHHNDNTIEFLIKQTEYGATSIQDHFVDMIDSKLDCCFPKCQIYSKYPINKIFPSTHILHDKFDKFIKVLIEFEAIPILDWFANQGVIPTIYNMEIAVLTSSLKVMQWGSNLSQDIGGPLVPTWHSINYAVENCIDDVIFWAINRYPDGLPKS